MTRVRIFFGFLTLVFLLLFFRLFDLEVIHGRKYRELGDRNCVRLLAQKGSRGKIFDSNGKVIVDNKLSYDLLILPQDAVAQERTISKISKVLGKSVSELNWEFKKGYLTRFMPVVISRNLELKQAIALDELRIDYPAIIIQPSPIGSYPNFKLACHLLGYLGEIDRWRLTKLESYGYKTKDVVGFGGVEEKYDYYLRGEEGGMSFQVDHRGRFTRNLGFRLPVNGKDIKLTIDIRVQKMAEDALEGRNGAVVVMNPFTGEIIALASSPGFNPKDFLNRDKAKVAQLFNDSDSPLINRAISGTYPAGSVFKIVVATAALETKKINSRTSFLCQGLAKIGRQEFDCWSVHGSQNLFHALTNSCNVFFYRTGLLVGGQLIHDYALKLGLSRLTGIDLPYEKTGFIPSPLWAKINKFQNWFDGDTANLSIGQGAVQVTPLQIARMMAVFANGGYLVTPYITQEIDGKRLDRYHRRPEKIGLKPDTIKLIREGLRGVVSEPSGTANILSTVGISVAGKTGTAQAPPKQSHSWFAGFFPYKNPKFVICVFLEHGGPGYNSCVLTKQIIKEMLSEGII